MFDLNFYNQLKKYQELYISHKYSMRDRQLCHNICNGRNSKEVKQHLEFVKMYQLRCYENKYFIDYIMYFKFNWVTYNKLKKMI